MKPWEDKKTVRYFRRMNGEKSVEISCSLTDVYLEIIKDSLKIQYPRLGRKKIGSKLREFLGDYGF